MPFDEKKADHAVKFISLLQHTKGRWSGKPFLLKDWQEKIVRDIFGTVDSEGKRQYRKVYVEIPRKNGKTMLAAALSLYMLLVGSSKDPEAEIYSAAADRDQASLVFNQAASMIRANDALSKKCKIVDSTKRIVYHKTNSFYRAIPADAASAHGYNASCVVVDELHTQPNRELVDTLETSQGAREEPLTIFLTTAGYDQQSICWEYHDYARKVNEGVIDDPTFYGVIWAADDDDDWRKPETWAKANPNLDVTITKEFLEQEARRAENVPAYQNTFKRLYLNIWTSQEERFIDLSAWDATAGMVVPEKLEGRHCYAGLDLSSTTDITALELVFPMEDGTYEVLSYFWMPKSNLQDRVQREGVQYDVWARQGFVELTEGNVIHYDAILRKIVQLGQRYNIKEVAYDRWGAAKLSQDLEGAGFTVVPFGQGYASMSGPTQELLKCVLEGTIRHGGNPVLRWMCDNLQVKQDPAGNVKPTKPDRRKSSKRIDGMVALIMGLDRAIRNESGPSIYESQDVKVL